MTNKKNVLAISGSTKKNSTNGYLIKAIQNLTKERLNISIFNGIGTLPHFNPDLDNDHAPASVVHFRSLIRDADGILISTPEYAMGVPGTLKNAIDWTVSSCEFSKKPVALITASTSGQKAHQSLLETLNVIEAKIADRARLLIPFAKTKVNERNEITDRETQLNVRYLIDDFIASMND